VVAVSLKKQFFAPEPVGSVPVVPEHLAVIRDGLWGVANRDYGTARWVFKDFDVPVAGKTGTAENPGGRPHAWFAGYAPADDPQIAISVLVENSGEGSVAAAPIFRSLVEAFLQIGDEDERLSP
jgi:penicillin-binding protein 2